MTNPANPDEADARAANPRIDLPEHSTNASPTDPAKDHDGQKEDEETNADPGRKVP